MLLNNFNKVRSYLSFDSKEEFYLIQVVRRSKDNLEMSRYLKVIKSFYVYSINDFNKYESEIISLCSQYNARAYLDFNKLNISEVTLKTKELLDKYLSYGKFFYKKLPRCFESACVVLGTSAKKDFMIVDIDEKGILNEVLSLIPSDKILFTVPTVKGDHIILKSYEKAFSILKSLTDKDVSVMTYCYVLLYSNVN